MKKTIYILKEHDFNQPSYLSQAMGVAVTSRTVDKTTSKRKAEAWVKKSGLNFYETI
jgi:hypothetical protein